MKHRFINLWKKSCCSECRSRGEIIFADLNDLYSQPWRSYHNLTHIRVCLDFVHACKELAESSDAIEFAIWFHDCIYVVGAKDNEECSKDLFLQKTQSCLADDLRLKVAELIMDTRHTTTPESNDGKLISDIDLISFGLPWDDYQRNSSLVQREIAQFSSTLDNTKRRDFFNMLLESEQIYFTPYFHERFEQQARENIHKSLEILGALD